MLVECWRVIQIIDIGHAVRTIRRASQSKVDREVSIGKNVWIKSKFKKFQTPTDGQVQTCDLPSTQPTRAASNLTRQPLSHQTITDRLNLSDFIPGLLQIRPNLSDIWTGIFASKAKNLSDLWTDIW